MPWWRLTATFSLPQRITRWWSDAPTLFDGLHIIIMWRKRNSHARLILLVRMCSSLFTFSHVFVHWLLKNAPVVCEWRMPMDWLSVDVQANLTILHYKSQLGLMMWSRLISMILMMLMIMMKMMIIELRTKRLIIHLSKATRLKGKVKSVSIVDIMVCSN